MFMLIQTAPIRWPDKQKHGIEISSDAQDLISKLLNKDKKARLGFGGAKEIMSHPFFKDTDWNQIEHKEVVPEYTPEQDDLALMEGFNGKSNTESLIGSAVM